MHAYSGQRAYWHWIGNEKERTDKFVNVSAARKSIYQLKQALQSQHRDHWKSYSEAMRSVDDRWREVFLWSTIRITVFPTTAVMARTVLITEKQMICSFKPWVNSSEQYNLASAGRVCIFLQTQNLKFVEGCHFFWPLYYVFLWEIKSITWHAFSILFSMHVDSEGLIYFRHIFTFTKCCSWWWNMVILYVWNI